MIFDYVLFIGLALVAIASAAGMLFSRNAIYAALNLVMNFLTVAIFYLLLGAPFIALTQITVYAGAIMVLFLFVIMLLGAERVGTARTLRWQRPLAMVLVGILIAEGILAIATQGQGVAMQAGMPESFGSPAGVGELLFSTYLLPFETISILLLAAMVGAIILTHKADRGNA